MAFAQPETPELELGARLTDASLPATSAPNARTVPTITITASLVARITFSGR